MALSDGYYWYVPTANRDDWTIVQIETLDDQLAALSGLSRATTQVVFFIGSDECPRLDQLIADGAQFDGPIERSAVPGLTSMQLIRAIDNLRTQAKADTDLAEAYSLAAEALAVVESLHGK